MAIIKCPQCNEDVSDKAKICPHCNYDIDIFNKTEKLKNDDYNPVARKFNLVVIIIKILGYFSAFTSLITFIILKSFWFGILSFIIICIATWLSTLIFEAIAEGLNLLENIKNKL